MDYLLSAGDILATTFLMFTLARYTMQLVGRNHGWIWVGSVFLLATLNMVMHRVLGTTVNPPFYAAIWFCVTLGGIDSPIQDEPFPWPKRGIYAAILGTILGWLCFARVVEI